VTTQSPYFQNLR